MSIQDGLDSWHRDWPLLQLYLYIDDMGVLAQGTAHVIKEYCSVAIVALDLVLTSVDAKLSRGSPGIPGGKSVVLSPLLA